MAGEKRKVVLMIWDGVGLRSEEAGNAVLAAKLPNLTKVLADYPAVAVQAAGSAVGLSDDMGGSSEAGHMALGTGQIIDQPLHKTQGEIASGAFLNNPAIADAFNYAKHRETKVHLVGILSDSGVHAANGVIQALLDAAKVNNYPNKLYLHLFLDGRDTPERAGQRLVEALYLQLQNQGYGSIATMIGRSIAMDRTNDQTKVAETIALLTQGKGRVVDSPLQAVIDAYGAGQIDEELEPIVTNREGLIGAGDTVIFYNERADRMRELFTALVAQAIPDLYILTYAPYLQPFDYPTMYKLPVIEPNLVSTIAAAGQTTHKITETERYAHLTTFINGRREDPYEHESRAFIETLDIKEVRKNPAKAVVAITKPLLEAIKHHQADCIIVNYPIADQLGHAGDLAAATAGLEALDQALGEVMAACGEEYVLLLTADHGNCEYMQDPKTHELRKEDTASPVLAVQIHPSLKKETGTTLVELAASNPAALLPDVTATVLHHLGIPVPKEMTGLPIAS